MNFCRLLLEQHVPQNSSHTYTDIQTDKQIDRQIERHFPEIIKFCLGHPKMCKSIKYWNFLLILSSICIEENKEAVSCF